MGVTLGQRLQIRSMIYVAAEPVPYFWPMRSFIHHNPLHGLEKLPFAAAVKKGANLFHGQVFLSRSEYHAYLRQGKVDQARLQHEVLQFLAGREPIADLDMQQLLLTLLTRIESPVMQPTLLATAVDVQAALQGKPVHEVSDQAKAMITDRLRQSLLQQRTVYESVDALYGTDIGASLDELVIKSCLDFFDEGQSVWRMPNREQGFFAAWREVARRNIRLFLRGLHINEILARHETPEDIIHYVMNTLQVPEEQWVSFFLGRVYSLACQCQALLLDPAFPGRPGGLHGSPPHARACPAEQT